MCGHGTIGVAVTLAHLGRIGPGTHRLETPVGVVAVTLDDRQPRRRSRTCRAIGTAKGVDGRRARARPLRGDVAWGGNWFFLVERPRRDARPGERRAADRRHLADPPGARARRGSPAQTAREIDHIELFGPPTVAGADSRNFVLCPGKAYDRSPCGTGTSAKLACLAADGKLAPGRGLAAGEHRRQRLRGLGPDRRRTASSRASGARPTSTPRRR